MSQTPLAVGKCFSHMEIWMWFHDTLVTLAAVVRGGALLSQTQTDATCCKSCSLSATWWSSQNPFCWINETCQCMISAGSGIPWLVNCADGNISRDVISWAWSNVRGERTKMMILHKKCSVWWKGLQSLCVVGSNEGYSNWFRMNWLMWLLERLFSQNWS